MATVSELLEYEIYPQLDRSVVFEELAPQNKGLYLLCECPECKQKSAYIYHNGIMLICNRLNNCTYRISIWDYVQKRRNLGNQETLFELARLAGVILPKSTPNDYEKYNIEQRKAYILETLFQWASIKLFESKKALDYLSKRGFSDKEYLVRMGLGFIPSLREMINTMAQYSITNEELKTLGIISKKWETHPLIGLWRNRAGQPWTMWGRCLGDVPDGEEKYYLLPGEGTKSTPYLLHQVTGNELVIVEGFLDALTLHLLGENRAVAIVGVYITQEQLKTIARLHIKRAIICLDPDRAGMEGVSKNVDNLGKIGIQSFVVPALPNNLDPDEFVLTHGISEWQNYLKLARKGVIWKTQKLFDSLDISSDLAKDRAMEEFLKFVSRISNPIETEECLQTAGEYLKLSPCALSLVLQDICKRQSQEELKQKVRFLLKQGQADLEKEAVSFLETIEKIKNDFSSLNLNQNSISPVSLDVSDIRIEAGVVPEGKKSGYFELDETIAIMPSELVVIGARPRHGKTSFACNLLMNWVNLYKNDPFIFFSYEVNSVQLFCKLVSLLTGRQRNSVKSIGYSYRDVAKYFQSRDNFNVDIEIAVETLRRYESQLFLVANSGITIDQLVSYSTQVKKNWGRLGAILVDYIELVKVGEENSEELRIASIVHQLRVLSQILDTPVVALAQMNRATVTGGGGGKQIKKIESRRPVLEGLRYSGKQEQEASTVLGLFNRYIESSDASSEDDNQSKTEGSVSVAPLEVITHKNRYGEANKIINMVFNMVTGNIEGKRK